jgi:hypothetical protein
MLLIGMSLLIVRFSFAETQLPSGNKPTKNIGAEATTPKLKRAIEKRFGRPDRIVGDKNCLLHYDLENGDTLTIVLADEDVVGIQHTTKIDLSKLVGKKVTLVGVYIGTKLGEEISLLTGEDVVLAHRTDSSQDGKLVSVTGVLKYFPATHGPADRQAPAPHYYMESDSVELKVLYPFKFLYD